MAWSQMRRWKKVKWLLATNRQRIDLILRSLSIPVSLAAVVAIIVQHGCYLTDIQIGWTSALVVFAYVFFIMVAIFLRYGSNLSDIFLATFS